MADKIIEQYKKEAIQKTMDMIDNKKEKLFVLKVSSCSKCPAREWSVRHLKFVCNLYELVLHKMVAPIHPNCQLLDADKVLEIK